MKGLPVAPVNITINSDEPSRNAWANPLPYPGFVPPQPFGAPWMPPLFSMIPNFGFFQPPAYPIQPTANYSSLDIKRMVELYPKVASNEYPHFHPGHFMNGFHHLGPQYQQYYQTHPVPPSVAQQHSAWIGDKVPKLEGKKSSSVKLEELSEDN